MTGIWFYGRLCVKGDKEIFNIVQECERHGKSFSRLMNCQSVKGWSMLEYTRYILFAFGFIVSTHAAPNDTHILDCYRCLIRPADRIQSMFIKVLANFGSISHVCKSVLNASKHFPYDTFKQRMQSSHHMSKSENFPNNKKTFSFSRQSEFQNSKNHLVTTMQVRLN